jgi:transposase-like protein
MATSKRIHQMTIPQWEAAFPDEDACKAYLARHRWAEGVYCPRCGATGAYELKARPFHWQCKECSVHGYRFSVLVGTIFENTNKPLREWFRVIHMVLTSKKGISSHQIYRIMGFGSYETALYMTHRIRAALADTKFRKLIGIVEADETFIGGSGSNKPYRHMRRRRGPQLGNKSIIAGVVERKGNVVARVVQNTSADVLTHFLREAVSDKVSLICTDQYTGYSRVGAHFPHKSVNHKSGEYVRHENELVGAIHTQTIEGFWSLIKRGMVGTFHKVSHKYLPLYVAEFQFRYNNRENDDIFAEAIKGC